MASFGTSASTFAFGSSHPHCTSVLFGSPAPDIITVVDAEGSKPKEKNLLVEASTQTDVELHVNKLFQGLKDSLMNGLYSDIRFNVKDKEFNLHRNILAAHSQIFAALMESENPVSIEDVDPDMFADFLYFMYTGSTEKLNSENFVSMYKVAKKYQVTELSSSCVKYMINHISLENFCDIMTLSLQYLEDELSEVITEYFIQNSIDIVETPKWLQFLKENTAEGNALLVKAFKLKRKRFKNSDTK